MKIDHGQHDDKKGGWDYEFVRHYCWANLAHYDIDKDSGKYLPVRNSEVELILSRS